MSSSAATDSDAPRPHPRIETPKQLRILIEFIAKIIGRFFFDREVK